MEKSGITVLGIFVADATFRSSRLPRVGETLLGSGFALGPGGKGSNQAIAAGRAAAGRMPVRFVTRLGDDAFADMAARVWAQAGVSLAGQRHGDLATGAAGIFVLEESGDNAIVVAPGAGGTIDETDIERTRELIEGSAAFVCELEQPLAPARAGLRVARAAGTITVFNPAPAPEPGTLEDAVLADCDYITPNETEAEALTGIAVASLDDARRAGDALLERGVGTAVLTLGARGALVHGAAVSEHVPAFDAGAATDTVGAGDAFNGAFAVALAEGRDAVEAARFGCASASISVTRPGATASPSRAEIDALLEA